MKHFSTVGLRRLLATSALTGVLFLAGCGASSQAATPTATPPPTATAMPTVNPLLGQIYTSTAGGYTIRYPADWTTTALTATDVVGGATLKSADNSNIIAISPLSTPIPKSQYVQTLEGFFTGAQATNIQVTQTVSNQTLPSGVWGIVEGTATLGGVPYKGTEFGMDHGGNTFFIFVIAPASTADADAVTYFLPMLQSFTFTK